MGDLPAIDSYRHADQSLRDTTKWLVAAIPGAGVALALVAVVPDVAVVEDGEARIVGLALVAVALVAIGVVIGLGARVLISPISGWGDTVDRFGKAPTEPDSETELVEALDRNAVLRTYGFSDARRFLDSYQESGQPDARHITAATVVIDFATHRERVRRFRAFLILGGFAATIAVSALVAARTVAATSVDPIADPAAVQLFPTGSGISWLRANGCPGLDSPPISAIATGGTYAEPRLLIADATTSCAVDWDDDHGIVVPTTD